MPAGRPTKFDPKIAHEIAEYVRYGATLPEAATSAGVHRTTAERWMRAKGEFCTQIERAQADFVTQNLRTMNLAANRGSWQASAWLLEHLRSERFSKAATELPIILSTLLQKLPSDVAGQVMAAWGISGLVQGPGDRGAGADADEPGA